MQAFYLEGHWLYLWGTVVKALWLGNPGQEGQIGQIHLCLMSHEYFQINVSFFYHFQILHRFQGRPYFHKRGSDRGWET